MSLLNINIFILYLPTLHFGINFYTSTLVKKCILLGFILLINKLITRMLTDPEVLSESLLPFM